MPTLRLNFGGYRVRNKSVLRIAFVSCLVLLLIAFKTTAGVAMQAGPLQEVLVRCSPEQLNRIRSKFGAAILDVVPGSGIYLLAVNSSVNLNEIKALNTNMLVTQNSVLS